MNTIQQIKDFDLSTYRFINEEVQDGKGGLVSKTDTRSLIGTQALKLAECRERSSKEIEYLVPIFKQINMANGVYDDATKSRLLGMIQLCRSKMDTIESDLITCEALAQVEAIHYSYEDDTKEDLENA